MMQQSIWLRFLLPALAFLAVAGDGYAQAIRYSRQAIKPPEYDRIQLIPGVEARHHLLFLKRKKPVSLFTFDKDLRLQQHRELGIRYGDSARISVIRFRNYYYLYSHQPGTAKHELWKVHPEGEVLPLTARLESILDSAYRRTTSPLQLVNNAENLVLIGNTYYEELKAVATTVVTIADGLDTFSADNISFPYDQDRSRLHQVMLMGSNLYLLKSDRSDKGYVLELLKVDLQTKKLFRKEFSSGRDFTRSAVLQYVDHDSSFLVHSNLGQQVFITKLTSSLRELAAPTLVPYRSRGKTAPGFLLLGGEVQQWLVLDGSNRQTLSRTYSDPVPATSSLRSSPDFYGAGTTRLNDEYYAQTYRYTTTGVGSLLSPGRTGNGGIVSTETVILPLRLQSVGKDLRLSSDTLFTNQKAPIVHASGFYANLMKGTKSHLILKQDFPRGRKGLVEISAGEGAALTTNDILVFEKYEYLLQDAQSVEEGVLLMPFLDNRELGLVELSYRQVDR